MTLVVDASVAVRWFVDGPFQQEARGLRHTEHDLIAPDLLLVEAANAMWRLTRAGEATLSDAAEVISLLSAGHLQLVPTPPLLPTALELAVQLGHPVYDCAYVALARRHRTRVVTADRRLANRGGELHVIWIEDAVPRQT